MRTRDIARRRGRSADRGIGQRKNRFLRFECRPDFRRRNGDFEYARLLKTF
jgi:hypothetical protein